MRSRIVSRSSIRRMALSWTSNKRQAQLWLAYRPPNRTPPKMSVRQNVAYCLWSGSRRDCLRRSRVFGAFSRYAVGSVLSWPIYAGLLLLAESIGMWPIVAATIAWVLSYMCVYAMQSDSAHRSAREFALYLLVVIAPSALVNFGLLELMQTHTK